MKDATEITARRRKSILWEKLGNDLVDVEERKDLARILRISHIIDRLLVNKKLKEAENILGWPGAVDEPGLVRVLIRHKEEDLAKKVVFDSKVDSSQYDLSAAFEAGFFDLCV